MSNRQDDDDDDPVLRLLLETNANESTVARIPQRTPQQPTRTLLPTPIASAVSIVTATSSLSLQVGAFIGNAAIYAARAGTLTSFEIGRVIFEGILTRAGQDVANTSSGDTGRASHISGPFPTQSYTDILQAYIENLLINSLSALHHSITSTAFLVSAGFQIGSTSLSSGIATAQLFLSALDAILGDTQTSRAVATIVVLAQREFRNPHTGLNHQKVSLWDILVGTIAFATLQRWGEKRTKQELEEAGVREVIWDMVVVAEIYDDSKGKFSANEDDRDDTMTMTRRRRRRAASFVSATGVGDPFDAVGDGRSFVSLATTSGSLLGQPGRPSEQAFRHAISSQLSPGTRVSLEAESLIQDTVVLDVYGDIDELCLDPPAGFTIVAREYQPRSDGSTRITFQRKSKKRRRAKFSAGRMLQSQDSSPVLDNAEILPTSPSSDTEEVSDRQDDYDVHTPQFEEIPSIRPDSRDGEDLDETLVTTEEPILANQKRQRSPLASRPPSAGLPTPHSYFVMSSASVDRQQPEDMRDSSGTPVRKSMRKGKSVRKLVDFWSRDRPRRGNSVQSLQQHFQSALTAPDMPSHSAHNQAISYTSHPIQPLAPIAPIPLTEAALLQRPSLNSRHTKNRSSIYSIASFVSETSMVPYSQYGEDDQPVAARLYRDGSLPGQFPPGPLVSNLARFAKFAIASYGSTFLRLTNSWQSDAAMPITTDDLPQHHTFSSYIRLPSSSVLLSSYTDPEGGRNSTGASETGLPLVHYISVDHESKAIVLTCRGTLGFEDILTDLTGDYDDVVWQGETHQIHRGILASARRLLTLHNSRVLATLKVALEEFPMYGLILCGHSLGGSVAAALAILLAQPATTSAGGSFKYVTATNTPSYLSLPPNRPIHAFAYGPAACFSSSLQLATRNLITTVIHGNDAVPFLSLGTLHDFQAMALSFAKDSHNAKSEVLWRIKDGIFGAFRDRTGLGALSGIFDNWHQGEYMEEEDHWPWIALNSLRASMLAEKLGPPGETFTIESQPVLQRHAFVEASSKERTVETRSFRPATHVKLQHVVDVERHFSEMSFGASMFADHFPGRYESVLATLNRGLGGGND